MSRSARATARFRGLAVVCAIAAVLAGCGQSPPGAPSGVTQPAITVTISGTVSTPGDTGRVPVEGAQVVWCDSGSCRPSAAVLSGADGRFSITATDAVTRVYLIAKKTGYIDARSADFTANGTATADLDLRLRPPDSVLTGIVSGVTPAGLRPLEGVTLTLCDDDLCWDPWQTRTGADGRYEFTVGAWSGSQILWADKPGWTTYRAVVEVKGVTQYDIAMKPLSPLCGGPGLGADGLPILSAPFRGDFAMSNAFDHDLPIGTSDRNGYQVDACGQQTRGGIDGHQGYDWVMPIGTPLVAAADGTISFAGVAPAFFCSLLGRTVNDQVVVTIRTDEGYSASYLHLSRPRVSAGQRVARGDDIGDSGSTGCSTGPHLHFEVRAPDGRITDPFGWQASGVDPWQAHPSGRTSIWLWRPGEAPLFLPQAGADTGAPRTRTRR